MFKFSDKSRERMQGVDDDIQRVFNYAITITPIDFGIPRDGGLRAAERQNVLYNTINEDGERLSKCDGYEDISKHQANKEGKSDALDFYAYVDGKASWEPMHLALVAAAILQAGSVLGVPLEWGGFFGAKDGKPGWDMPHIQKRK